MEERRRLHRFDLALPTTIKVLNPAPGRVNTTLDLITRDVSSGGAFFRTHEPLSAGTRVKVKILFQAEKLIDGSDYPEFGANGSVVRTEPTGMAVCFNGRCYFGAQALVNH